ncbi:MAG: O-antigen ligase family protein [Clostridia bacterium]
MFESYILQKIKVFIACLIDWYRYSVTEQVLVYTSTKLSAFCSESVLCKFIGKDERISDAWHDSLVFRWIEGLIKLIISCTNELYTVILKLGETSICFNGYKAFVKSQGKLYILKLICLAAVLFAGVLTLFISPLKAFIILAGIIAAAVTFLYFEIGLSLFIFGVFIIPHQYWNNLYSIAAVIFYTIVYIMKVAVNKQYSFSIKVVDFIFLLFAFSVKLSTLTSITPVESIKTMLFYAASLLLVVLLANSIHSRKGLNYLLLAVFAAVLLTSAYAVYQGIVGVEVDLALTDVELNQGMPGRVYSTLENPNNYAEYLILLVPFCVAYILNLQNKNMQIFFGGALSISFLALALTYSRAGYVAFAITAFVFIALRNWKLIPLALVVGIVMLPFLPQSIMNRIMTISNFKDSSISYRFYIWEGALDMLKDYWITGIGIGPEPFARLSSNYMSSVVTKAAHSHMLFLEIWIEMGIVAIISFMWCLIRTVKKSIKVIYSGQDKYLANILIAGIAALTGISFMGLVEYVWFYPRIMFAFWLVFAFMMITLKLAAKEGNV